MLPKDVAPWPAFEGEATVQTIRKHLLCEAQLHQWRLFNEKTTPEERLDSIGIIIGHWGVARLLEILHYTDSGTAEEAAKEYWAMCDFGDSFGERIWEDLEALGIDPATIKPE